MDLLNKQATFVRIVESGSLAAAAKQLRISAAAVSRQLATPEAELLHGLMKKAGQTHVRVRIRSPTDNAGSSSCGLNRAEMDGAGCEPLRMIDERSIARVLLEDGSIECVGGAEIFAQEIDVPQPKKVGGNRKCRADGHDH